MSQDERCTSVAPDRRQFGASAVGLSLAGMGAVAGVGSAASGAEAVGRAAAPLIKPGATILFQGDSITDAHRSRAEADQPNSQPALGNGYAWLAAAQLLVDRSGDGLKCFNRGISGNKVFQLAERWQQDCLDLKPDVLSILIGVNDFWHTLDGKYDGTVEKYETDYRALLKQTREALPAVRLVIGEPFVLRCGAVTEEWFPEFDKYRAAARRIAEDHGGLFVPYQNVFDAATKLAPPQRWAEDGVHPSADGAALMAHAWRQVVDGA